MIIIRTPAKGRASFLLTFHFPLPVTFEAVPTIVVQCSAMHKIWLQFVSYAHISETSMKCARLFQFFMQLKLVFVEDIVRPIFLSDKPTQPNGKISKDDSII